MHSWAWIQPLEPPVSKANPIKVREVTKTETVPIEGKLCFLRSDCANEYVTIQVTMTIAMTCLLFEQKLFLSQFQAKYVMLLSCLMFGLVCMCYSSNLFAHIQWPLAHQCKNVKLQ